MRAGGRFGPDWRDSQAYAPLLGAERALLAWEWLRRDPAYRKAAELPPAGQLAEGRCGAGPGQWGLHAFEPPELAVPGARPVWRLDVHPYVLPAYSAPGSGGDILDLGRLAPLCRLVAGSGGGQHLLICDGLRSIRIDIIGGTVGTRVRLRYLISGFETAEKPLVTLRRRPRRRREPARDRGRAARPRCRAGPVARPQPEPSLEGAAAGRERPGDGRRRLSVASLGMTGGPGAPPISVLRCRIWRVSRADRCAG